MYTSNHTEENRAASPAQEVSSVDKIFEKVGRRSFRFKQNPIARNYDKCWYAECRVLFIVMASVVGPKGLFTRPISEADFAVSECLLQNIIIFIFRKMG